MWNFCCSQFVFQFNIPGKTHPGMCFCYQIWMTFSLVLDQIALLGLQNRYHILSDGHSLNSPWELNRNLPKSEDSNISPVYFLPNLVHVKYWRLKLVIQNICISSLIQFYLSILYAKRKSFYQSTQIYINSSFFLE